MGRYGYVGLLFAMVGACMSGEGGPTMPDPTPQSLVCARTAGAVDLVGQWGIRADLRVQIEQQPGSLVVVCPNPQERTASIYLKMTTSGLNEALQGDVQVCHLELPTVSAGLTSCPMDPADNLEVTLSIDEPLRRLLPEIELAPFTVDASSVGDAFEPASLSVILGAMLPSSSAALPAWDPMRTGCTGAGGAPDSCVNGIDQVFDHDEDGQPGVTLHVASTDTAMALVGSVYTVLRETPTLYGTVQNTNCIDGSVTTPLEFSIIDSDVRAAGLELDTPNVIRNIPPFEIMPDSSFRQIRADGDGLFHFDDNADGDVSCTEIVNHGATFDR